VLEMSWILACIVHTRQLVIPWRHASLRLITWTSRERHLTAGESTIRTIYGLEIDSGVGGGGGGGGGT